MRYGGVAKQKPYTHNEKTRLPFMASQMMLERVKTEIKADGAAMFALEPTGHYWIVLGQFFEDHNKSNPMFWFVLCSSRGAAKRN